MSIFISTELIHCTEFLKWLASTEGIVWLKLVGHIVRSQSKSELPNIVYEKFYKQDLLATSWRQEALAKELGYSSGGKSVISRQIKKLVKKQLIKIKKVKFQDKDTLVYEIGRVVGKDRKEVPYAIEKFVKKAAKERLDKTKLTE